MTTTTRTAPAQRLPLAGRYRIDPADSNIQFSTRHLFGLAPVRGTFAVAAGAIAVNDPVGDSLVQVEIDATAFHTGNRRRDAVVQGPRFLGSGRHPTITFRADGVDFGDAGWTVPGALTVRGVARPVTLRVIDWEVPDGARSFRVRATTRVDRRAYGITASRGMAGRYLDLTVRATCLPS